MPFSYRLRSPSEEDEYWYNKKCDWEENGGEDDDYDGKQEDDAELLEQSMTVGATNNIIDESSEGWEQVPADLKKAKNAVKNAVKNAIKKAVKNTIKKPNSTSTNNKTK